MTTVNIWTGRLRAINTLLGGQSSLTRMFSSPSISVGWIPCPASVYIRARSLTCASFEGGRVLVGCSIECNGHPVSVGVTCQHRPRRILLFNTISVCLCEHCCQHCTVRNPGALHCESRATELVLFVAFACHCPSPPLVCKVSRSKVNLHVYDHETRRAELGASSRILDTCVYILTLEVSSLRLNGSLCGFCAL